MSTCMFPDCVDTAKSRGLCEKHYQTACRLVQHGHTTWEELIDANKCLPSTKAGRNEVRDWFLDK